MGCNCKMFEIIVAIVILVFTFWNDFGASTWIVAIAAILLLLHALMCKKCANCGVDMDSGKGVKKKSSKKK